MKSKLLVKKRLDTEKGFVIYKESGDVITFCTGRYSSREFSRYGSDAHVFPSRQRALDHALQRGYGDKAIM